MQLVLSLSLAVLVVMLVSVEPEVLVEQMLLVELVVQEVPVELVDCPLLVVWLDKIQGLSKIRVMLLVM